MRVLIMTPSYSFAKDERDGQRYHMCKSLWPYVKTQSSIMGSLDSNKNLRRKTWIPSMILCYKRHHMSCKGNPLCSPSCFPCLYCLLPNLLLQHLKWDILFRDSSDCAPITKSVRAQGINSCSCLFTINDIQHCGEKIREIYWGSR
jgi:hypothetical protein